MNRFKRLTLGSCLWSVALLGTLLAPPTWAANFEDITNRIPTPASSPPGLVLHVAPQGNDQNTGNETKPFATLEAARDAIRRWRAKGALPNGGIEVRIHGGNYQVTKTFELKAEDSGQENAPIVYRASPGETPRFRGGVTLSNLQPVQDQETLNRLPANSVGKVREVDLRAAGITKLLPLELGGFASGRGFKTHPAHEVFFNGQPLRLARGPNEGFLHVASVAEKDGTKGYDREGSKIGKFRFQGEIPKGWLGEPDLMMYGYWFWDWADSYERVESMEAASGLITLSKPYHNYGYAVGAPFFVLNALSELDLPGEYYLDRKGLRLLLIPPAASAPGSLELSLLAVPMLTVAEAANLRFEGLTWELGSADGIKVTGGSNCVFAGCVIRQMAGNGIEILGGQDHSLLSCDIYSMGRGGAVVHGGDRRTLTPGRHLVENCDIHDLSRIDHTYTPAVWLEGVGNRLSHNRFHDVLSSAMRVEGNDQTIEFNEIFNAVTESDDQGGADMFGNPTYRGNVFRNNYWHHIGNWRAVGDQPKCGQAGIRLDDAICGTLIYGNIFEHCSAGKLGFGGIQIHGGKENVVDNNVFIDCAAALSFSAWDTKRWREFVAHSLEAPEIDRNLYLQRYPSLAVLSENPNVNTVSSNLMVRCGEMLRRAPKSIRSVGNVAVQAGEINGQPDNPLFNHPGFARIPVEKIGLYRDSLRKTTGQP